MRRLLLALACCLPAWLGAADFAPVVPGRAIELPADHGAHPEFRTEWWYVTGWLSDPEGRERGFQLTFFRVRSGLGEEAAGRFSPAQLILAHAAIADPATGRLRHAERSARSSGALAGSAEGRLAVWLGDWRMEAADGHIEARARGEGFTLDLRLTETAPPMRNGEAGFSRKGPDGRHASYYYSLPALAVAGTLELDGRPLAVSGDAWLDHEWSSALMPDGAVGWDWVGINLADGGAAMAFRMRDAAGNTLWAGGSLRSAGGDFSPLGPDDVRMTPGRSWRSPRTGARYPVTWTLQLGDSSLQLEPLMDDQELDARQSTGAVYWEGAVRVLDKGRPAGRGYLEMTGYVDPLEM